MNTEDPKWESLSRKLFPDREVHAPPFLWTRVLTAIEHQENALANAWWRQWRWMTRWAAVVTLLVSVSAGWVFYDDSQAGLDELLHGITNTRQEAQLQSDRTTPIQLASADTGEGDLWVVN
jgi:hypothetical protein